MPGHDPRVHAEQRLADEEMRKALGLPPRPASPADGLFRQMMAAIPAAAPCGRDFTRFPSETMSEQQTTTAEPEPQEPMRRYAAAPDGRVQMQVMDAFESHEMSDEQRRRADHVRSQFRVLAYEVMERTPPAREQSLVLTKLEEASFFAVASIAREKQGKPSRGPTVGSA